MRERNWYVFMLVGQGFYYALCITTPHVWLLEVYIMNVAISLLLIHRPTHSPMTLKRHWHLWLCNLLCWTFLLYFMVHPCVWHRVIIVFSINFRELFFYNALSGHLTVCVYMCVFCHVRNVLSLSLLWVCIANFTVLWFGFGPSPGCVFHESVFCFISVSSGGVASCLNLFVVIIYYYFVLFFIGLFFPCITLSKSFMVVEYDCVCKDQKIFEVPAASHQVTSFFISKNPFLKSDL